MSLFSSIQMAGNTLQAMQIGLHVVGNNIANANTPGYIRERVVYTPAPTMKVGDLTLGLGVEIAGIVQSLDRFAEDRLRGAGGDRASAEVQEKTYLDLEAIVDALGDQDISSGLTAFFGSLEEIASAPQDVAARNFAVLAGKQLADRVTTLHRRVDTVYTDFGSKVQNIADEVNSLTEQVRKLNLQIVSLEGGRQASSEAGGLRSQRNEALRRLSEIADVDIRESDAGAVNVSLHGEVLVFEGTKRDVAVEYSTQNGLPVASVAFADNGSLLAVGGGELHGTYEARDQVVGGFLTRLDEFAAALAFEFNKVYSQGQGMTGIKTTTSQNAVTASQASLDDAGLAFTPTSGTFNVQVFNTATKLWNTHTISVDLDGLDNDTSLASLAAQLEGIDGISAQVTSDLRLRITSDSAELRLAFENDTSGALAALGLNTFFTGSTGADLGVNAELLADGSKFAASRAGIGVDVTNIPPLVALHDEGVEVLGGRSFTDLYDQLLNDTAQGSAAAGSIADGFRVFEDTLAATAQAGSGVNLDEEAIDMIMLQQTYQASARFISTLSELMDTLINL
ncbi:MAG TPA: flagellar hook-associated protein FlgK [Lacipirellulaceae bacterium]|nr:flagellar hook-associated protein FlgK [Lacipirellulaceae bacterium]